MELFGNLLRDLQEVEELNGSLLDNTMMIYGCHMGDANIHNNANFRSFSPGAGLIMASTSRSIRLTTSRSAMCLSACFRRWASRPTASETAKGR